MEGRIDVISTEPGPFADIIALFVEERRQLAEAEPDADRREGRLAGLTACEIMRNSDVKDFELAVLAMVTTHKANRRNYQPGPAAYREYENHRYAMFELTSCYDLLRGAYQARNGYPYGVLHEEDFSALDGSDPFATSKFTSKCYRNFMAKNLLASVDFGEAA